MNAEKLHRILLEIENELIEEDLLNRIRNLKEHLQNQINQPQVPSHQINFANSLQEIYDELEDSLTNDYSPGWKQIIKEIGGEYLLGEELKASLEAIFSANSITPSIALSSLEKIIGSLEKFEQGISKTIEGLSILNIGSDELSPGTCELGYLIPRSYVKNKLSSLQKEIAELSFILGNISEIAEGKKEEFEVRTISSSDFLLYVIVGLTVADILSSAIERIINNYKTILEIKTLRNQLKEKGVPSKDTKGIESYANKLMKDEIDNITAEVIEANYTGDPLRKNEISNGLRISLNKIANRIDQGFNIEIRVEALEEGDKEIKNDTDLNSKYNKLSEIQKRSKTLEYKNIYGEQILQLKENND